MVDGGFLCAGQDPVVTRDRYEMGDMEDKNKGGGSIPPSNYIFKVNRNTKTILSNVKGVF